MTAPLAEQNFRDHPLVSVILPVFNEEDNIGDCLRSIRGQDFDQRQVEVLLVDDHSTDRTLEIAAAFGVTVVPNGAKDCEVGKAIGIRHARGRYLLFIDADNRLDAPSWLTRAVRLLEGDNRIAGVQSWKFRYDRSFNAAVRYLSLWGNTDPLVYYLRGQDHLKQYENSWRLGGKVLEDAEDHVVVRFAAEAMPTLGSQGFVTRRSYFREQLSTFHHTEFFIHVVEQEPQTQFAFLKCTVSHLAFDSVRDLRRMFGRNIHDYLRDSGKYPVRRYGLSPLRMLRVLLTVETLAIPLWDAFRGFLRIPDPAWFLHVYLGFVVPWTYANRIWKSRARSLVLRRVVGRRE